MTTAREARPILDRFEAFFFDQEANEAAAYDRDYFLNGWREGGNAYDLETRRRIEGKHPRLIREVFAPRRALDLGCGPGALMTLLREEGVEADGVDVSPAARDAAPETVRSRIVVADLAQVPVPDRHYDLVICREVLEHLAARHVVRAVREMCRLSDRFVYLTTRFHPAPADLLDVTHERHVDPTHITLLNQEFLRLLLVLEGFKARPDLERRMDWLQKGRVLVYERQPEAE